MLSLRPQPMFNLRLISYLLWVSTPILQAGVSLLMARHSLNDRFKFFFAYTVFRTAESIGLFAIYQATEKPYREYFLVFYLTRVIDVGLTLAVIQELYDNTFAEYDALRGAAGALFRWGLAILVLVAAVTASSAAGSDISRLIAGIMTLYQAVAVVRVGLLLLLFVVAAHLRLRLTYYVFGIALGFALYASIHLAAIAVRSNVGAVANIPYNLICSAAYTCAALVWVVYLLRKEPSAARADSVPEHQLREWNDALMEVIRR